MLKFIADFGIEIAAFALNLPVRPPFGSFGFSAEELVLKNFLAKCLFSVGVFVKSVGVIGYLAKELSACGLVMFNLVSTFCRLND